MSMQQANLFQHQQLISKLKGYKQSVKEFRRNILIKTKQASKIVKFNSSANITPKKQNMIRTRAQSSLIQLRTHHPIDTHSPFTLENRQKSIERQNLQNKIYRLLTKDQQQQKRMDEYLSVVHKKVEDDTQKIIRAFQNKIIEKSNEKKLYNKSSYLHFIKRMKLKTIKVRNKGQKSQTQLRNRSKTGLLINTQSLTINSEKNYSKKFAVTNKQCKNMFSKKIKTQE